jgi:hypothetical protein
MQAIAWALKANNTPEEVRRLAQAHDVEESYVAAMSKGVESGTFIFEDSGMMTAAGAGGTGVTPFQQRRLENLADRANRAEGDLGKASILDLEALAALSFPAGRSR